MSKLNEAATTPSSSNVVKVAEEKTVENEESKEGQTGFVPLSLPGTSLKTNEKISKSEGDKKEVLRFTMLFNKYNCDLDVKRSSKNVEEGDGRHKKDVKCTMFFNKEVTISPNAETLPTPIKCSEQKKTGNSNPKQNPPLRTYRNKSTPRCTQKPSEVEFGKPQISEPEMMFSNSLTSSLEAFDGNLQANIFSRNRESDNLRLYQSKRNPKLDNESSIQMSIHPASQTDLRIHNSLTSLSKNNKSGLTGTLKSKIPSLTSLETNCTAQKSGFTRFSYWEHWDDLFLVQNDVNKHLNLQISKSCYDNYRRSAVKLKKEDVASVSDSKLLYAEFEPKKQIKKCDKKSRGDSSRKERDEGNRKQVQWKTEVDVIYFSTHLASNGDRTGEVIGRVMEPLREEWEQQRKGFYAKMVPYHMESHLKDRFISLLKI